MLAKDPDILVSTNQHSRNIAILEYLFTRMSKLSLDLDPGRDSQINKTNKIEGRICLSNRLPLVDLIEKAQFGFIPLGLVARYGIHRIIDSRNCYELVNRGFVIPRSNNKQERIRTVEEIIIKDKGGMIFSPRVGLHENIAVLDYENEYTNLILKHNLSYETVTSSEGQRVIQDSKGLLTTVLESVLRRRILLKSLQKSFLTNTNEWLLCEQRIVALKDILVSLYGTHWFVLE